MPDLVDVHGLWSPAADSRRIAGYPAYAGIPDLDIRKSARASDECRSFQLALDIGAHIGAVTTFLSDRFDEVVAFEAVPDIYAALERNVARLPNVRAVHAGVSNAPGELYFEYAPGHTQLAHARFDGEGVTLKNSHTVGPIKTVTIDSYAFENVAYMKIDVEGLELPVIEGALETIKRCRPVVLVEQNGNEEKHHGRPRDEASRFLEALGMSRVEGMPFHKDRVFRF